MQRRTRRLISVTLVAGLGTGALVACDAVSGRTFKDDATVSQKITSVRLDSRAGGVELRGGKGVTEVSVHRTVTYHDERPQGASHRVENGVLVLGGCGRDCSVNYTVELPAGLPVSGGTTAGAIRLSRVGKVNVGTSDGAIELDGVSGRADVRTSNGRIHGRGLAGGPITARTTNGEIDLAPGRPQDVRAETSNGAITLTVPAARYDVSARTSNGDKRIEVSDDPDGRYRLDLTTSNGSITVDRS
ncbi:DUF4097 family beta strand repeat-containing protein [Streptomyces sp. NPDC047117]|uniref:DUF4097 family beta strand repeat-containing protein n=1 Tax=Streptomyces sp. NPDC047117 TaxID=3155379 RepID=UPI0033F3723B